MKLTVAMVCAAALLMTGALAHAQAACELGFERIGDDWVPSPLDANSGPLSIIEGDRGAHTGALKIEGRTPRSLGVTYFPWRDWTG
mgnify:FL=1